MRGPELIPLADTAAWQRALLEVPHAFGHTWRSCEAMHRTTGFETFLYRDGSGARTVVCPIALRPIDAWYDVVTPYGFGGFTGDAGPGFMERWSGFAAGQGWVCGYIGLHPLLAPAECRARADYAEHNELFVLDLRQTEEQLFRRLSSNRRRQVRTASRGAGAVEDTEAVRAFFLEHVHGFLQERGASDASLLSRASLEAILECPETLVLGGGDDRIDAAFAFSGTPRIADYLFGVTLPSGRARAATLIWHAALRFKSLGVPFLNLGGGIRPGDGVAEFKRRFGADVYPLGALRQVYRPNVYESLCRQAGVRADVSTGYFPQYRAPRAVVAPR